MTNAKEMKLPGPEHSITVEPILSRVVASAAGKTIANTRNALILRQAAYPAVLYIIPRGDIDMSLLVRTKQQKYCPYKGERIYFSVPVGSERSIDAAGTFETPYPAVGEIKDRLAFYPKRVDPIAQS